MRSLNLPFICSPLLNICQPAGDFFLFPKPLILTPTSQLCIDCSLCLAYSPPALLGLAHSQPSGLNSHITLPERSTLTTSSKIASLPISLMTCNIGWYYLVYLFIYLSPLKCKLRRKVGTVLFTAESPGPGTCFSQMWVTKCSSNWLQQRKRPEMGLIHWHTLIRISAPFLCSPFYMSFLMCLQQSQASLHHDDKMAAAIAGLHQYTTDSYQPLSKPPGFTLD